MQNFEIDASRQRYRFLSTPQNLFRNNIYLKCSIYSLSPEKTATASFRVFLHRNRYPTLKGGGRDDTTPPRNTHIKSLGKVYKLLKFISFSQQSYVEKPKETQTHRVSLSSGRYVCECGVGGGRVESVLSLPHPSCPKGAKTPTPHRRHLKKIPTPKATRRNLMRNKQNKLYQV